VEFVGVEGVAERLELDRVTLEIEDTEDADVRGGLENGVVNAAEEAGAGDAVEMVEES